MKASRKRGALLLLPLLSIGLFVAARSLASWRPVRSGEVASEFEKVRVTESSGSEWNVFKKEDSSRISTNLRIVNTATNEHFERVITAPLDEPRLEAMTVSPRGDCFYSCAYLDPSSKTETHASFLWLRASQSPLLVKRASFDDALFSADGKSLYALSSFRNTVAVFDTRTAKLRDEVVVPRSPESTRGTFFQFVPERGVEAWTLLLGSDTIVLNKLNLQTQERRDVAFSNCRDLSMMPSKKGHLLLSDMDELKMFDASTGALLWRLPRTNELGMKLSPDETMCVVAFADQFKICDAHTGRFLRWLPAAATRGDSGLQDFDFSSDSNRLITAYTPNDAAHPTVYFSQRAR